MRRNGFRVIHKELKTFYDGTRKANLDVEIAVDMLSLAGRYDTAVLVSGDEDFVYAVNAVAYKGCRVEVAGFRSNTAPKLIDVADYFIDLGDIADKVRKEPAHSHRYYDNNHAHEQHQNQPAQNSYANHAPTAPPPQATPDEMISHARELANGAEEAAVDVRRTDEFEEAAPQLEVVPGGARDGEQPRHNPDFVRVTDDQ